jgi:glyoxylase-like metal-dependent hydrolase (beta-lactamase superfamily II)
LEADWTEPGAHPVVPGVWRIPLPLPDDGLKAVNVYAIAGDDGLTLIDGGWALEGAERHLDRALGGIDAGLGDVRRFLVTHAHRDHYTQALVVRRLFGSTVLIGIGEQHAIERLTAPDHGSSRPWVGALLRSGAAAVVDLLRRADQSHQTGDSGYELPDAYIADGEKFDIGDRVLEALPTPGHTRGHVVFLDRAAGVLFSGDHVLPHITPSIGFEIAPAASPLRDYMESLRLMLSLPDATLLPAHGPVSPSVHARVEELLDHHEARLTATAKAVEQGADTAFEAARILRWTRRERHFDELDVLNQRLATSETMAHLDVLVEREWLRRTMSDDGVAHYTRA